MGNDDDTPAMIHSFDRVLIPAVLLLDDHMNRPAGSTGILEPVMIPVIDGSDAAVMLGDGFTANLTGVFEPEDTMSEDPSERHRPEPDESQG